MNWSLVGSALRRRMGNFTIYFQEIKQVVIPEYIFWNDHFMLQRSIQLIIKITERVFNQRGLLLFLWPLFRSGQIAVGPGKVIPHVFQLLAGYVGNTLEDHQHAGDFFLYIGVRLTIHFNISVMSFVTGITLLVRHIQRHPDFNQTGFIVYFFV